MLISSTLLKTHLLVSYFSFKTELYSSIFVLEKTTQMHGDRLPKFSPTMQKALGRLGERLYDEANDLAGNSNDVIRTLNSLKVADMTKDSLGYIKSDWESR
ncbi:hypothetical protein ACOSQ3_033329 [Xanthoceras sorbifolium]